MFNKLKSTSLNLDKHTKEVLKGSFFSLLLKILGAVLTFAFNVAIARKLGSQNAGIYYIALTFATVASIVSRIGFDNILLQLIASNAVNKNWNEIKSVHKKIINFSFILSLFITALIITSSNELATSIFRKPELSQPIQLMALSITPTVIAVLNAQALKGLKEIFSSQIIESAGIPALSLIGLYILSKSLDITGAILSYVLATVLVSTLGYLLWKRLIPKNTNCSKSIQTKTLILASMPLFCVDLMGLILNWSATFFLGIWGENSDVGVFNAASRLALLISFILIAITPAIAPKFAELYKLGDIESLKNLSRKSANITTIMALPVITFFVFNSTWLMSLFGKDYVSGNNILIILSLGQFVNVVTGSVSFLLIMSGKGTLVRDSMILGGFTNIIGNIILVPLWGIIGAAIATSVSYSVQNVYAVFLVWKHLKIKTYPFF